MRTFDHKDLSSQSLRDTRFCSFSSDKDRLFLVWEVWDCVFARRTQFGVVLQVLRARDAVRVLANVTMFVRGFLGAVGRFPGAEKAY